VIDHVSVGTTRYAQAVDFYGRVLAPLGLSLQRDTGAEAAFGTVENWSFFLYPVTAEEPVTAPGMHLAFGAASRSQVAAVHRAALSERAAELRAPQERPDISATYFGAMFTDLDGHRIEVKTDGA
jgi:catechol 2,3-dioxygenase-like lactoylglutathione lyase family enzyme